MSDIPDSLTTAEEKVRRFEEINAEFMDKYFDLVWFARADKDELLRDEIYEGLKNIKRIEEKYPEDVKELCEDETNWNHGFNSGILAYSRFLATYIEDQLIPLDGMEDEIDKSEIITIDGENYIQEDGREFAVDSFPELDT